MSELKYKELADKLRNEIKTGVYRGGQRLPGELELDLELATGLRNFSRFVDRAGVLSSISDSAPVDDDEEASAPAPRTAIFRLGG